MGFDKSTDAIINQVTAEEFKNHKHIPSSETATIIAEAVNEILKR